MFTERLKVTVVFVGESPRGLQIHRDLHLHLVFIVLAVRLIEKKKGRTVATDQLDLHSNWKTKGVDTDPKRKVRNTGQTVGTRDSAVLPERVGVVFSSDIYEKSIQQLV